MTKLLCAFCNIEITDITAAFEPNIGEIEVRAKCTTCEAVHFGYVNANELINDDEDGIDNYLKTAQHEQ